MGKMCDGPLQGYMLEFSQLELPNDLCNTNEID